MIGYGVLPALPPAPAPFVIIGALTGRKLLVIINAMIRDKTPWQYA